MEPLWTIQTFAWVGWLPRGGVPTVAAGAAWSQRPAAPPRRTHRRAMPGSRPSSRSAELGVELPREILEQGEPMSGIQRRDFLTGAAAAAAATATVMAVAGQAKAGPPETGARPPEPVRGNEGAPILGPRNPSREAQSPDRVRPPTTDSGTLPTLRWSFADSHVKMREGGWSRQ